MEPIMDVYAFDKQLEEFRLKLEDPNSEESKQWAYLLDSIKSINFDDLDF